MPFLLTVEGMLSSKPTDNDYSQAKEVDDIMKANVRLFILVAREKGVGGN